MATGLTIFRKWQAALEAARGTVIPATRKIEMTGTIEKLQPGDWPDEDRGYVEAYFRRNALLIETRLRGQCRLSFEDFPWWLQLFVKGSVVASGVGPYTYAFTPSLAADDRKTACFEGGDDTQAYSVPFAFGEELEVSWKPGEAAVMKVSFLAKDKVEQAFTAALVDRVIENALGRTAKLWIDDAAAGIGTTQQLGRFMGFNWKLKHAMQGVPAMDGAAATVADIIPGRRMFEAKVLFRFDTKAEFNKWAANTTRFVRVTLTGSANRSVAFDFAGAWEDATMGDDQNMVTVEMTLRGAYDPTLAFSHKITVINNLAVLP